MTKKPKELELELELMSDAPKSSEPWPEGRYLYYEGDNFEAFADELVEKFGFDPRKSCQHEFHCPAEFLDVICDEGNYPLGT